jgi:hypothetical protein
MAAATAAAAALAAAVVQLLTVNPTLYSAAAPSKHTQSLHVVM